MKTRKPLRRKTPLRAKSGFKTKMTSRVIGQKDGFYLIEHSIPYPGVPSFKKPRKPMRRVAKRKVSERALYVKERAQYLKENPVCMACVIVKKHSLTPGFAKISTGVLVAGSEDIHHKAGRLGPLLRDQRHWLAICRECHDWIHANGAAARKLGLYNPPK